MRTRHVNTRYHFVRENLDDGITKIEIIKSVENQSDIFTKNVTQEIYERRFWRSISKGSLMAERFSIGRYWKYPLRSSQLVIRIFIRDTEDLSDQPISGYGDAFN
jgi:hypothetical protein